MYFQLQKKFKKIFSSFFSKHFPKKKLFDGPVIKEAIFLFCKEVIRNISVLLGANSTIYLRVRYYVLHTVWYTNQAVKIVKSILRATFPCSVATLENIIRLSLSKIFSWKLVSKGREQQTLFQFAFKLDRPLIKKNNNKS